MRRIERDPYEAARTEPFTNPEMLAMSGVSLMTLHLWRQGTATKSRLPAAKGPDGRVRFPVQRTLTWMRRHGIVPAVHPDDVGQRRGARKSGPPPGRSKRAPAGAAAHH